LLSQFKNLATGMRFGVALGAGQESGSASEQSSSEVEVLVDQGSGSQHRGAFEWIGFCLRAVDLIAGSGGSMIRCRPRHDRGRVEIPWRLAMGLEGPRQETFLRAAAV